MKQWQQKVFGIVLFIAAIFLILANFEESSYAFSFLFELIQPVIVAGVLAFFLHIPMNGFRNFLQKHAKRPHKERFWNTDRKSTRLNSSHTTVSRMPSSA